MIEVALVGGLVVGVAIDILPAQAGILMVAT